MWKLARAQKTEIKELIKVKHTNKDTWTFYIYELYQTINFTEQETPDLESNKEISVTEENIIEILIKDKKIEKRPEKMK